MSVGSRNSIQFLLCLIMVGGLFSCQKEIDDFETYPGEILKQRILFSIEDEKAMPLEGVTISFTGKEYTSDPSGISYIHEVLVPYGINHIVCTKKGYFRHDIVHYFTAPNGVSTLRVRMSAVEKTKLYDAREENEIHLDSISLFIPENALVHEDGKEHLGRFSVAINRISPNAPIKYKSFQGHSGGIRKNGTEVAFENFGQFQIDFYDESSRPLKLKTQAKVHAEYVPQVNLPGNLFDTSPVWMLDRETGIWKEYSDTRYAAGKFSFDLADPGSFMIASAFPPALVSGRVVSADGFQLVDEYINFIHLHESPHSVALDADGTFSLILPQNEELVLELRDGVGDFIEAMDVGSFQVKTDIGEVAFEHKPKYHLLTRTTDCRNNPIDGGYVTFQRGDATVAFTALNSDVNSRWDVGEDSRYEMETFRYFNIQGEAERYVLDSLIDYDIGPINGCATYSRDEWTMFIDGEKEEIKNFITEKEGSQYIFTADVPDGKLKLLLNKNNYEAELTMGNGFPGLIMGDYALVEEYAGGVVIASFKIHYEDAGGEIKLIYGRLSSKIS